MDKRKIIWCFALLTSPCWPELVAAKCAMEPYRIEGKLVEEDSRTPISGASVFVFFDDQEGTWSQGYETKYPDYFTTDTSGNIAATAYFDRYSGYNSVVGDQCKATPARITLVIVDKAHLTKRLEFKTKQLKISGSDFEKLISLPVIDMRSALANK
jgi:hypothetical protein